MSLARRTRAVATARPGGYTIRAAGVLVGVGAAAVGIGHDLALLAAAGAFTLAWNLRPEAERAYLEGFSDGLAIAPDLEQPAGAPAARQRGGDPALVRGLPAGPATDEPEP